MTAEIIFEPDVIVSEQAQERKKRFRENKQQNGLTDKNITLSKTTNIYFDDQGEIVCVTKDPEFPIDETWNTHEFTSQEMTALKNRSFSEFLVVKNDSGYQIKPRKSYQERSLSQEIKFQEVTIAPTWDTDLTELEMTMSKDQLTLQITPKGLEYLEKYKDSNYQIKNQKVLSVYITLKKNPHYLIHDLKVPLTDFLSGELVVVELDQDYTAYSIYTKPLFDYCARV